MRVRFASLCLIGSLLVACGGKTTEDPPDPGGPPTLGPLATSPDSLSVDRVSSADDGVRPDGVPDGVFTVTVVGPLKSFILITTDESGRPSMEQQWDTVVGTVPLPHDAIGTHYELGNSTWVLGVMENGKLLNRPDGSIPPLGPGVHTLRLFGSINGVAGWPIFEKGTHFRLLAQKEDGTLLSGPVSAY